MGERNGVVVSKQALRLSQEGCSANQTCCEVVESDSRPYPKGEVCDRRGSRTKMKQNFLIFEREVALVPLAVFGEKQL